jgi:hypothetical protein
MEGGRSQGQGPKGLGLPIISHTPFGSTSLPAFQSNRCSSCPWPSLQLQLQLQLQSLLQPAAMQAMVCGVSRSRRSIRSIETQKWTHTHTHTHTHTLTLSREFSEGRAFPGGHVIRFRRRRVRTTSTSINHTNTTPTRTQTNNQIKQPGRGTRALGACFYGWVVLA